MPRCAYCTPGAPTDIPVQRAELLSQERVRVCVRACGTRGAHASTRYIGHCALGYALARRTGAAGPGHPGPVIRARL